MNAMNLNAATRGDFIEFVAATFFRVQAALSVLNALQGLVFLITEYRQDASVSPSVSPLMRESLHRNFLNSATGCISSVVMAVVLFFLAVPLARLIRRSLSHAWEPKPQEART